MFRRLERALIVYLDLKPLPIFENIILPDKHICDLLCLRHWYMSLQRLAPHVHIQICHQLRIEVVVIIRLCLGFWRSLRLLLFDRLNDLVLIVKLLQEVLVVLDGDTLGLLIDAANRVMLIHTLSDHQFVHCRLRSLWQGAD